MLIPIFLLLLTSCLVPSFCCLLGATSLEELLLDSFPHHRCMCSHLSPVMSTHLFVVPILSLQETVVGYIHPFNKRADVPRINTEHMYLLTLSMGVCAGTIFAKQLRVLRNLDWCTAHAGSRLRRSCTYGNAL